MGTFWFFWATIVKKATFAFLFEKLLNHLLRNYVKRFRKSRATSGKHYLYQPTEPVFLPQSTFSREKGSPAVFNSDTGIPAFWASPLPKPLLIWASPSHITLAIWVRVRVTGDAHITSVLVMGMPISLWHRSVYELIWRNETRRLNVIKRQKYLFQICRFCWAVCRDLKDSLNLRQIRSYWSVRNAVTRVREVACSRLPFRGRAGVTDVYGLYRYVPLWRVWFSSSLLWDRVCKSESLGSTIE